MFPAENGCAAIIAPIAVHPINKNAYITFDLSADPEPLAQLGVDQIRERLFTRQADLPEGVTRLPLKLVHINKCPVLVTPKMVDGKTAERLNLDPAKVHENWQRLRQMDIEKKLQQVYKAQEFAPRTDPEQQLYDGFFSPQDKQAMFAIRNATAQELATNTFTFKDKRLPELLFRYRARNFPESLTNEEMQRWQAYCFQRVTDEAAGGSITLQDYYQRLDEVRLEKQDEKTTRIVQALLEYGDKLV
jgi:exodeoxyribonuclease-1